MKPELEQAKKRRAALRILKEDLLASQLCKKEIEEEEKTFNHLGMELSSYEVAGVRKVLFPEDL